MNTFNKLPDAETIIFNNLNEKFNSKLFFNLIRDILSNPSFIMEYSTKEYLDVFYKFANDKILKNDEFLILESLYNNYSFWLQIDKNIENNNFKVFFHSKLTTIKILRKLKK